jgi:hypothetical protein
MLERPGKENLREIKPEQSGSLPWSVEIRTRSEHGNDSRKAWNLPGADSSPQLTPPTVKR